MKMTGMVVTSISVCSDTDAGRNYAVKGDVYGFYYLFNEENFHEEDRCEGDVLIEYYCVEDGIHSYRESAEYICPGGCEEGRCMGRVILEEFVEVPKKVSFLDKIRNLIKIF